jgi:hypothetical protein
MLLSCFGTPFNGSAVRTSGNFTTICGRTFCLACAVTTDVDGYPTRLCIECEENAHDGIDNFSQAMSPLMNRAMTIERADVLGAEPYLPTQRGLKHNVWY